MNWILFVHFLLINTSSEVNLPVNSSDIELTSIGDFGLQRKSRPTVPAHLHTGVDIKRPSQNYIDEPILAIAEGIVISKREDGPYAQLIIEQRINNMTFWTVYEHIAEIKVDLYDEVHPNQHIARFFNRSELNEHGWQFDHFHFEVLKKRPLKLTPSINTPYRHFHSFTLQCYTEEELLDHFYDPIHFLFDHN